MTYPPVSTGHWWCGSCGRLWVTSRYKPASHSYTPALPLVCSTVGGQRHLMSASVLIIFLCLVSILISLTREPLNYTRDEQNTKNEDDNEPLQSVFVVTVIKRWRRRKSSKQGEKKNQIKSNGERKVVLIGTCLRGGGHWGRGEVSLQVILLCTKHFDSLDKYGVDHPWILPYLHIYIQSASTSISSNIKASSESCSMATAGPTALASLVS